MKKVFLIILLILIGSNLYAQNELNIKKESNKFRIGIFYSLDKNLSSENVSVSQYTGYSANYNKNNYKIGLNVEYKLSNKFSINSGLNYSNKNFEGTYYYTGMEPHYAGYGCYMVLPEKIDFQFLEIPLSFRYYFLPNKVKFFVDAGIINQFSINGDPVLLNSTVAKNEYTLSGELGVGLEYNINEKLAMQFITGYSKGFSNIFEDSEYKNEILSFRLGIVKRL